MNGASEPVQLTEAQGISLAYPDRLGNDFLVDVRTADSFQPFILDRPQGRPFLDRHHHLDTALRWTRFDLDVIHQIAGPQGVHLLVQLVGVIDLSLGQTEVVVEGLLGQRLEALVDDLLDRLAAQVLCRRGNRQDPREQESEQD